MPSYDLKCSDCGLVEEISVRLPVKDISGSEDDPWHEIELICDACGGNQRVQIGSPSVLFLGGGWARKDY